MGSRLRRARDRLSEPVGAPEATVAAICFRRRPSGTQVRLIRSADGERWTFPNAPQKPGQAGAEAAAAAAARQAGVEGVVADTHFATFRHSRRADDVAAAFLLAVQSVAPFTDPGRAPEWFDLSAAHEQLSEGRDPADAQELQQVLQSMVAALRDT